MKKTIEQAIFINRIEDYKAGYDRIYFGNEFCQNLIPSLNLLKAVYRFSVEKKKGFTFVTPFVTEAGLNKLKILLQYLNNCGPAEIVFNDWGVFFMALGQFKNLNLVAGRLLTKQRRDPRMLKILSNKQKIVTKTEGNKKTIIFPRQCPPELFEHYRASVVNVTHFQAFLSKNRVGRVELDNLFWEMNVKVKKGIGVSMYVPYGYITTTRMCSKLNNSYEPCGKKCKKYFIHRKHKSLPVPFYSIGNTVFYKLPRPTDEYLHGLGIDRIVYQPKLPF